MNSGGGKVVCVTGASGFIASWLVKLLLERGYTVNATVRSLSDPMKVTHLKALEGAEERLHLFQANLTEEGSFDSAISGCEGVFHTASPVYFAATDPQAELIEPAVKGTINVLKSCSNVAFLRRVVVTSSLSSVSYNRNPKSPDVVVDETWFSDAQFCQETKQWYPLSKTLAEQAAWKFAEENGIDLVVLNPGSVIGPFIQPTFNFSSEAVLGIIKGKEFFPSYRLVDVRDVALAHILAFEIPSAKGRYCLAETALTHSQFVQILAGLYPSFNLPAISTANKDDKTYQVSKKKAESLGLSFIPFEVSIKDTVECLREKNFLML